METVAFIHIPKCAGSAMANLVNKLGIKWWHVPAGIYVPDHEAMIGGYKDSLSHERDTILSGEYQLIFGHFRMRDLLRGIGHSGELRLSTMLRDPVDRIISEYHYYISKNHNGWREARRIFPSFEDFVFRNTNTEVMSSFLEEYRGEEPRRIADRIRNSFFAYGFQDRFSDFAQTFAERISPGSHAVVENINVTADKPGAISSYLRSSIVARNRRDVELYRILRYEYG